MSPKAALGVGLKVDADALPADLAAQVRAGRINLEDPGVTLALLKLNAVVGATGRFRDPRLNDAAKSPFDTPMNFAAKRGDELFSGKAKCSNCHVEPLWTEPGWNMHKPSEICTDDFQANRAPDRQRTSPLGGLWTHQKGGFYHDGRFATLHDVVDHYDSCMSLGLTEDEKSDLIAYLLTL